MTNYKEKYPIGSQWECRDGSRAVVVDYEPDFPRAVLVVWLESRNDTFGHNHEGLCRAQRYMTHGEKDLITPWKEERVFEDEVLIADEGEYGVGFYFRSRDLGDCTDTELDREYNIIARKKITITEGEGV